MMACILNKILLKMYLTDVFFQNHSPENPEHPAQHTSLLNQIINQWRYNGQIIGREIPLFYAEQENEHGMGIRVICPEQTSLLPENNNSEVERALQNAEKCGLFFDSFQIVADDFNSDGTFTAEKPNWQVLYTTSLQTCSPLHNGDDLAPIPLYKQLKNVPHLAMDVIKWQENWQACDQLQMNGSVLEQQALSEISDTHGNLFKHGYHLTKEIECHSGIPTYYYLYRVGGESLSSEQNRLCPLCHQKWVKNSPHFMFYFKCEHCRLVSNLSWSWQ